MYCHDKRAGNFGDAHKHVALISALTAAIAAADASCRRILYIETHSGSGSYECTSTKAEDTGVGRVLSACADASSHAIQSPEIQAYADTVRRYRGGQGETSKKRYPGSPVLALSRLRSNQDEALCAEHQQEVADELSRSIIFSTCWLRRTLGLNGLICLFKFEINS